MAKANCTFGKLSAVLACFTSGPFGCGGAPGVVEGEPPAPIASQQVTETAVSLVKNGSFSADLDQWIPNVHTGIGKISVEDVGGTHAKVIAFDNPSVLLNYQLQVYQDRIPIKAGHCYKVSFAAKADDEKQIAVGMGKNVPDWRSYGLWTEPVLTKKWTTYTTTFVANTDASDTRFSFNFGTANTKSWLDDVKLQDLGVRMPCS